MPSPCNSHLSELDKDQYMTGERNHHADCVTDVGAEACKSLFYFPVAIS